MFCYIFGPNSTQFTVQLPTISYEKNVGPKCFIYGVQRVCLKNNVDYEYLKLHQVIQHYENIVSCNNCFPFINEEKDVEQHYRSDCCVA